MLRFVREQLIHDKTEALAEFYRQVDSAREPQCDDNGLVEVDLEGLTTSLSYNVVSMMQRFNKDLKTRARLGHDCCVFAFACESQNAVSGLQFGEDKHKIELNDITLSTPAMLELDLSPGQVAFTDSAIPGDPIFFTPASRYHLIVRASERGATDSIHLYASKIGTEGPVVLHDFKDLAQFYPQRTVGKATDFVLYPPSHINTPSNLLPDLI
jgi:hypothetical protein